MRVCTVGVVVGFFCVLLFYKVVSVVIKLLLFCVVVIADFTTVVSG